MGLVEILPHARRLLRRIREAAAFADELQPDLIITVDSPGFAHRFIKRLTNHDAPRVHYVAPSVWAWKPGRVHKFKRSFDHLLALLPFEPPYFEKVGLPCHFVGHSILESGADRGDGPGFRKRHGLAEDDLVLCLLPGSRAGEVTRLADDFSRSIDQLRSRVAGRLRVVIPAVPHLEGLIGDLLAGDGKDVLVVDQQEKFDAMAASNLALAASGTVALELAMARVPSVVAYKVSGLTYALAKPLVKIDHVHLINILLGRMVIPELLQKDCRPEALADALENLLQPEVASQQLRELDGALARMRPDGDLLPSQSAALVVKEIIAAGR